jgi:hypothetical protein
MISAPILQISHISQTLSDAKGKLGHIRTPLREIPQLLSKAGTGFALSGKADDTSAISDRCLKRITAANAAGPVRKRGSVVVPKFVQPMQCEAVTELTGGEDWTFRNQVRRLPLHRR